MGISQKQFRKQRWNLGVYPVYKRVDTCAAEFESGTAYMYSTYDEECEANPSNRDKIMVLVVVQTVLVKVSNLTTAVYTLH